MAPLLCVLRMDEHMPDLLGGISAHGHIGADLRFRQACHFGKKLRCWYDRNRLHGFFKAKE